MDVLSRLVADYQRENEEVVIAAAALESDDLAEEEFLVLQCNDLPISYEALARETIKDEVLKDVVHYVRNGWPNNVSSGILFPFYCRRDNLSVVQDCILSGNRVVVPNSLMKQVLQTLHRGHPGIVRMKAFARNTVYWAGIDSDIENYVKSCEACAVHARQPKKVELHPWEPEDQPWKRIHVDYVGPFKGYLFFLVVDAYSKWPEVFQVKAMSTEITMHRLESLFCRFGFPEVLVSDNGTQFTSQKFEAFCKERGINHLKTAPYHPQSNGQAERFVDIFKRTVSKLISEQESWESSLWEFLRTYRAIPVTHLKKSPSQLFLGRQVRTQIDLLRPPMEKASQGKDSNYAEGMKLNFDRHHGAKPKSFSTFDLVYYTKGADQRWLPGFIFRSLGSVLYLVKNERGDVFRRHANQLKPRYDSDVRSSGVPPSIQNAKSVPSSPIQNAKNVPSSPKQNVQCASPPNINRRSPVLEPIVPPPVNAQDSVDGRKQRSTRSRKPPEQFQINPYAKSYKPVPAS